MTRRPPRRRYQEDFDQIRAFLREWDAIGVYRGEKAEDEWPPDEYDSYIPHILSLLGDGYGADRIASHLEFARTQQMGLPSSPSRDLEYARRIEAWWRSPSGDQPSTAASADWLAVNENAPGPGLTISVVDPDDSYLGIEVRATGARFAGTTFIYAAFDALGAFAAQIDGFPTSPQDERSYQFGNPDAGTAGGFVTMSFRCVDGAGHAVLDVAIEDDPSISRASARFAFRVAAAEIDRFTKALRDVEGDRSGVAELPAQP